MISVRVLFFANLAEAVGLREHVVKLAGADLKALMQSLSDTFEAGAVEGDEIAFLPPVTGG